MNKQPDYLVLCQKEKFMLPIYEEALRRSNKSLKFLQNRYIDAVLVDRSGNTKKIIDVSSNSGGLLQELFVFIGLKLAQINCTLLNTSIEFSDLVKTIDEIATEGDSYSVWTQFYDSKADLSNKLKGCTTIDEILQALHVSGEGDTSEILT